MGKRRGSKKLYRIGEVSAMTGLEAHVIRYWEREFEVLSPHKSNGGHRFYSADDVAVLRRLKKLIHEDRFTHDGVRQVLERERTGATAELESPPVPASPLAELDRASAHLRAILELLGENITGQPARSCGEPDCPAS